VESLQPINATPPDLRDEMCGSHRKRPAAEDADDESESSSFMLSNLPPGTGKASALLKDRPDAIKAIAVFVGAAKNAAENQFATARAKIQKLAKGKNPKNDAKAAPATQAAAPAQPTTNAKATAPVQPLQTVSAPPSGAFTPASSQPERAARKLPAATDVGGSALSFAPAAKADPAPLTAVPDAKPTPAVATAPAPKSKSKPKDAKNAAAAKQAAATKQAAAKETTASKQTATPKQP
jgi:D-alanyl-D-alanine carboxypeptidase